jgi:hypothetical protein
MNALSPSPANDDGAIVEPQAPSNLIAFLARAVHDPSVDVHKLEAIYRIIAEERREQRSILADEARVRATDALNKVSAELKVILRNRYNDHTKSKFADLQAVDEVVRPIYTKHGFSISFDGVKHDGEFWVRATLRHVTPGASMDHVQTYELPAPPDLVGAKGAANKTEIQGICSATTYMRRYLKFMIFDAATGDDNDGNRITQPANDTGEVFGREAIDLLTRLIAETKTDERKLLTHMGFPDLTTIKDVPAREFAKFKGALLTKKNVLAQRAAREANFQTQQGARA